VKNNNNKFLRYCILLIASLFSSGCATIDGPPNPDDPLESFNRSMFSFNEQVDKYAFKPAAETYNFVMPNFASKVSNSSVILMISSYSFNQLLQFKFAAAGATSARFVFNSTFGLLGLIDVATEMGLHKHNEDFGQTLAVWGMPSGPYLVLPFLGSLTIRDSAGLATDWTYFDPIFKRQTFNQGLVTLTIKYIDIRAGLIKASNVLDGTVPDKYAFVRDAWTQRRQFLIYDGHPPDDFSEDDLFDDEDLFKDDNLLEEESMKSNMDLIEIKAAPASTAEPAQ